MLTGETLLTIGQVCERLPFQPNFTTVWRWCSKGIQGTRLESVRAGRRILTSVEALDRFMTALAVAANPPLNAAPLPQPKRSSARPGTVDEADRHERVKAQLAAMGVGRRA